MCPLMNLLIVFLIILTKISTGDDRISKTISPTSTIRSIQWSTVFHSLNFLINGSVIAMSFLR